MHPVGRLARWSVALLAMAAVAAAVVPDAPTIVQLQPERRIERVPLHDGAGRRGTLTLTQLNPAVNAWLLLQVQWSDGRGDASWHLENPDPEHQQVMLDVQRPGVLVFAPSADGAACDVLATALAEAKRSALPYAPLCGSRLYLRNPVAGRRTMLEATTGFLRDHVWRGEHIVGFVRRKLYQDAYVERGRPAPAPADDGADPAAAPAPAAVKERRVVLAEHLGIDIGLPDDAAAVGRWYAAAGLDGVFVSVAQPRAFPAPPSDALEADALAYLVAFDLGAFDVGFALGTDHPRLGWSARVPPPLRAPGLPGPDGIAHAAPLVRSGMVSPALAARTVATFTGGFKREHGAFRYGALASVNGGSHYGFVEHGVVFSRLVPGLSTLVVLTDGTTDIRTWRAEDDTLLPRVRHARQNGVPLLERGEGGNPSRIGPLVEQWGAGNWSGSADEKLRTLRAGACVVEHAGRRFLVYGWFSTTTPRTMASVFQAYGCRDAMHLDMNALEHTYLALYPRAGSQVVVEHLVDGMAALDEHLGSALVPRFVGFPDDRDFFYVTRRR